MSASGHRSNLTLTCIVSVRPDTVIGTSIAWSSQIAQCPGAGPISHDLGIPGEGHRHLNIATSEAELVPGLYDTQSVYD